MQVIRFGANVAFARLLLPEAFGIMALVNVLLQGLHMLSDAGVWVCVVQSPRGEEPKFLQTAWTVQVVRGFYLWLASFLIAWPAAWFYEENLLFYLIPVAGTASAISGFNSVSMFLQNRRLALFRLSLIEVVSYAVPVVISLVVIQRYPTVWVLVFSALGSAVLQMLLSHLILPHIPHRFRWEKEAAKELLGFGRWVFISTFFTFLATQADRLIVGAATSVAQLGIYHIAAMFASAPTVMLTTLANNLMLPFYSRLRHNSEQAQVLTGQAHRVAGIFAWALAAELVVSSRDVIDLLYRGPYEEAGLMLPIVAIVSWFQMLQALGGAILFAHGRAQSGALVNFLKLTALAVLAPLGLHYYGLEGLLWSFAVAEFARYLLTLYAVHRLEVHLWTCDLVLTLLLGAVFAATAWDLVGKLGLVSNLADTIADHLAWARQGDRSLHLSRLIVESFAVLAAGLALFAFYWAVFGLPFVSRDQRQGNAREN
jgi:O-antigen/teichoic acid export membrane protein